MCNSFTMFCVSFLRFTLCQLSSHQLYWWGLCSILNAKSGRFNQPLPFSLPTCPGTNLIQEVQTDWDWKSWNNPLTVTDSHHTSPGSLRHLFSIIHSTYFNGCFCQFCDVIFTYLETYTCNPVRWYNYWSELNVLKYKDTQRRQVCGMGAVMNWCEYVILCRILEDDV
jgi:hypothetical protein